MAQLRAEAVQARRLAEHINSLSQDATKRKREPVMNDTTIVDPEHAHQQNRRAADNPRAGGRQSSFNPLHPSMELPPEQLIRLLGLEGKKIRKKHKPAQAKAPTRADTGRAASVPATEIPPVPERLAPMRAETSVARRSPRKQRARQDLSAFPERRTGLLLPAVGIGVLAGLAVTAYLFWWQPAPATTPTARPAGSREIAAPPKPLPVKRTLPPSVASPVQHANAPARPAEPALSTAPKWQAALTAQEQRLHAAAEQRLNQRIQEAERSARQPAPNTAVVAPPGVVEKAEDSPGSMSAEPAIPAQNPTPDQEIPHAEALEASPAVAAEAPDTAPQTPANLTSPAPSPETDPVTAPDSAAAAPAPAPDAEPAPDASATPESHAGTEGVSVTSETGEQAGDATAVPDVPAAILPVEPGETAQSGAPDAAGAAPGDATD